MNKLIELLKSFYGLAASIGILLPGYTFFTSNAPPIFKEITIITSALSIAILVITANTPLTAKPNGLNTSQENRKGLWHLLGAFILLLFYLILLDYTSITNFASGTRWQIGFNTMSWSSTNEANELLKQKICPAHTKEKLLECTGFTKENILLLWKHWTVYLAGISLVTLFTISALLWTRGWGILARNYLRTHSTDEISNKYIK